MTLAIIGSAARREDTAVFTLPVWNNCKRLIYKFVQDHNVTDVISGGAAGIDGLAAGLFNAKIVKNLTLALPCEFMWQEGRFFDNGEVDWRTNSGGTLNFYHDRFSQTIGKNTLLDVKTAIFNGAKIEIASGLMDRNGVVAKADKMIAMTFGKGAQIKWGGTMDTCKKYLANGGKELWHVDLNTMKLFEKGEVQ